MNYSLNSAFIFIAGAVIGSLATWKILEAKYKRIADEEIASVKEMYSKNFDPCNNDPEETEPNETEEYEETVSRLSYNNYEPAKKEKTAGKPHIISPEEYGENDDYETDTLTYYSDGVLTDDMGNPIEDVDNVVGYGFESHFGEYEEDSVHVRNDKLKTDYEILAVDRNYSDIKNKQRPSEDE